MRSFETLISTNQTMKVSLTPNRLITIETQKRPPKLAPREPVSRERIIQQSSPASPSKFEEFDDDDDELFGKRRHKKDKEESLWEFLKNTSPDDVLGDKVKKKDYKSRVKNIDKLESVSEIPKTPSSPNNSRYTPLIPSVKSSPSSPYQSDRFNAAINKTLSSSRSSDDQSQSRINFSPPLHHSKSLDQTHISKSTGYTQISAKNLPPVPKPRPDPLDLIDDDDDLLYSQGPKKPKRRHENQDLIDFLSTSPPKDSPLNNEVDSLGTGNVGKKKEKKLKKLLLRLKKSSFSDESTSSLSSQRLINNSTNSFSTTNTYSSNSTASTLVNKPARYIKIEIPKIPPKEDNKEQSIFDQVEIQGRHARQISRASLSGSTRSPQYTPNRSTFSNTGGMTSPTTILEKNPSSSKSDVDNYDEYMGITTVKSKKYQTSPNIQLSPTTNTSTLSQSKVISPASPQQIPSYNNNVVNKNNNNQISSQGINKVMPALPEDQKLDKTDTLSPPVLAVKPSSANKRKSQHISAKAIINENEEAQTKFEKIVISKESIQNKEIVQTKSKEVVASKKPAQNKVGVQTKSREVVVSKEPAQNKETVQTKPTEMVSSQEPAQNKDIISHDDFLASIIKAEIFQDVQKEITIVTYNEEESEEALVVEWLLGTSLTFKNAMTYVDIMQGYEDDEVPEIEKSEYEDADDTEFIDDYDDGHNSRNVVSDIISS
ncbi:hypothetical protein C1645_586795 [Glomus cerebriforme]|uniref:Uncharacterized protein n=1 Tax=Glomus cerebriforme TaxID=658196 RepID=A0A397TUS1_9GLOM|nr:hypothetical protein C1645_586795 [Glomus cerebriforme]